MKYDILGIGNAIVDVLSYTTDAQLSALGLTKGGMTLIDEAQAEQLYAQMGVSTECSGGSAANTLAGLASLGARCAFIGKVKDDQLGALFRHDMQSVGMHFSTPATTTGPATARCLVLVTPDGERTMATYLGACSNVVESDVDAGLIESASITYAEGYLWDQPAAKAAIRRAFDIAKKAKRKIALTLSDTFCVDRHRAEFLGLIENYVDILFANEAEIHALFETKHFDEACARIRAMCPMAAITRSEKGCVIVTDEDMIQVPAGRVAQVTDTTGAGDLFASGFLFGVIQNYTLEESGALGNRCAGQIIQQLGARSLKPLDRLVA